MRWICSSRANRLTRELNNVSVYVYVCIRIYMWSYYIILLILFSVQYARNCTFYPSRDSQSAISNNLKNLYDSLRRLHTTRKGKTVFRYFNFCILCPCLQESEYILDTHILYRDNISLSIKFIHLYLYICKCLSKLWEIDKTENFSLMQTLFFRKSLKTRLTWPIANKDRDD